MKITWLDSNSWLIETEEKKILLDPWLVGSLVFVNLPWLFKGDKTKEYLVPEKIDLILLSQGLDDHTHIPTLEKLDHNIPVVGSPNAGKVCERLGYAQINVLEHNQSFVLDEQIEIKAVPGSPIGPNLVENGYIIRDLKTDKSLYYEPHGFHSPSLKDEAPVDIVITPLISLTIPLLGSVIQGKENALEACKLLSPQFILPTAGADNIKYEGVLTKVLKEDGSIDNFSELLSEHDLDVKVIKPKAGEPIIIK